MAAVSPQSGDGGVQPLYYCYACGRRLRADDEGPALQRGESHTTACCLTCARLGRRIENPQAYEVELFQSASAVIMEVHAGNPLPDESSAVHLPPVASATASRRSPPHGHRRPTGGTPVLGRTSLRGGPAEEPHRRAADRPLPRKPPPLPVWALGAAGAGGLLLLAVVIALLAGAGRGGGGGPASNPTVIQAKTAAPVVTTQPARPAVQSTTVAHLTPPPPPPDPSAQALSELPGIEQNYHIWFGNKNYTGARERLKEMEMRLAALKEGDEARKWRGKVQDFAKQIREASAAALAETLKELTAQAEEGKLVELQQLFARRKRELLEEDVKSAEEKLGKLEARATARRKELDEERMKEQERLRAAFEESVPASLGNPSAKALFGPEVADRLKSGAESLRRPEGKVPYLDGSARLEMETGGGVMGPSAIIIEYSAKEDLEVRIVIVHSERTVAGLVVLPAGANRKAAFQTNGQGWKEHRFGGWLGRTIKELKFDFQKVKPHTLGIFRISITGT